MSQPHWEIRLTIVSPKLASLPMSQALFLVRGALFIGRSLKNLKNLAYRHFTS